MSTAVSNNQSHVYTCRLYHHIKLPSELRQGHDYAVFKQGIRPMWEDDANKMGGRWLVSLEKKQRNSDLDRFWLDTVSKLVLTPHQDHASTLSHDNNYRRRHQRNILFKTYWYLSN